MRLGKQQAAGRPAALEAAAQAPRDLGKGPTSPRGTSAAVLRSPARAQTAHRQNRQPFVPPRVTSAPRTHQFMARSIARVEAVTPICRASPQRDSYLQLNLG